MKKIVTLFVGFSLLHSSAFAGECRIVARVVGTGLSTHSTINPSNLSKCAKSAAMELSPGGYNKAFLKHSELNGTVTVLEIKKTTNEAYDRFNRNEESD